MYLRSNFFLEVLVYVFSVHLNLHLTTDSMQGYLHFHLRPFEYSFLNRQELHFYFSSHSLIFLTASYNYHFSTTLPVKVSGFLLLLALRFHFPILVDWFLDSNYLLVSKRPHVTSLNLRVMHILILILAASVFFVNYLII